MKHTKLECSPLLEYLRAQSATIPVTPGRRQLVSPYLAAALAEEDLILFQWRLRIADRG